MAESTTTEQKGRFKIKNVSKTTLEEGALDSIRLPRSDTPSSIDGTNISTDKTVTAVVATTGNIDQNKVDHSNTTPAEMTIETQVVKKTSRFTVKTVPNEDISDDRNEQVSTAMKPAQQPQQANTNPADKSEPSAAATAAVMYGKMEALMQANMKMMAQLMEATKRESTHSALPTTTATATAVSSSSKLSVDTTTPAATVTGSAIPVLPPAAPLTRTISREREAGSAPSPVLPATTTGAAATATGSTGTPTAHSSTSHFSTGPSTTTTTQSSSTSMSVPPIGASSLSTDEKDVHFNKLSHYLTEMKRELDLAQKQRKEKALESQRLREKCQQLEERLRSEQRKISRLEEQAATYTTTTDNLHMQIASLNETVAKQNMELNKYRTGRASGSAELAPTGTYLPQSRSNGSLHSAQSALSEGSTVLPLAPSTSGTQLSFRDTSSEALTGRSASAGGPATLLCQSRSGGNLEEYFLGTPPVSPPQGYHKHLSRGSAVGSMKSVSVTAAGGSDRPPASATGATVVSDPEGTGQSQYRKKSIGSAGGMQSQADLQMKQMLENAVNNINPAAARSKPSPTMTATGAGSGGGSSGAVSTSTGLHPSGFSSGNGTPTYRLAASTGFKPLSAMGTPHGMAYTATAASSQLQMSGMGGHSHAQPMQQQQHQQQYAGYPQQSPQQQQQQQQHIYPKPIHQQQQDGRGGGYGGHNSPASYLGSNTFPLQQQQHQQQQQLGAANHNSSHMQQKQQHSGGGMPSDRDSFNSVGGSSSDASLFNSMAAGSSNSNNNSSSTIGSSCMGKVRDELDGIAARSSVHSHSGLQSSRGGDTGAGGSSKGVVDSGL